MNTSWRRPQSSRSFFYCSLGVPRGSSRPTRVPAHVLQAQRASSRRRAPCPEFCVGRGGRVFWEPGPQCRPRRNSLWPGIGRPRDAILVGRLRHRSVLDGNTARHLVFGLHSITRIKELTFANFGSRTTSGAGLPTHTNCRPVKGWNGCVMHTQGAPERSKNFHSAMSYKRI